MIRRRGTIDNTNSILDAWIMVEHLSEGEININDEKVLLLNDLTDKKYKKYFQARMKSSKEYEYKNSGLVLYLDIFKFAEVVEFLREKYGVAKTQSDINYGNKFSIALYFDKNINFISDNIFFTCSGYMRYLQDVPSKSDFQEFEEKFKEKTIKRFEGSEDDLEKFDNALNALLNEYNIDIKNCRVQILSNIETEATNLHSFFIEDLNKAKEINNANLKRYLTGGNIKDRINLDSKNDSPNYNQSVFEKILEPQNYPLGRFPSKTEFALSFMQQVAVNLTIGYDNSNMRSVNGPPGTGKTTLLKDIFAELVVKQAHDICLLTSKYIKGSKDTIYYGENASIGVLTDKIAENNIVVASSNNGAVQNIVNELPLKEGIDDNILPELEKADYFKDIANADMKEERFWGTFSLEGGKAENMTNILNKIECIAKYLDEEYKSDSEIYNKFKKQYEYVSDLRSDALNLQKKYADYKNAKQNIDDNTSEKEEAERAKIEAEKLEYEKAVEKNRADMDEVTGKLSGIRAQRADLANSISNQKMLVELKRSQKGGFLDRLFNSNKNKAVEDEVNALLNRLQKLVDEDETLRETEIELQNRSNRLKRDIDAYKHRLDEDISKYESLKQQREKRKAKYNSIIEAFESDKGVFDRVLDFEKDYDSLQMSNPWFDKNYRIEQSKLFVLALQVRKEFLYENRKNLNAAINIWKHQKNSVEKNKKLINIAWNWMNLCIPVISSTFASFSRMLKNIDENVLGHTFVDEAGQALPQAAVGAVFRSKNIMVVGDPFQIKPVLTLDEGILALLSKIYNVSEIYLSDSACVQTLVDAVSKYGFYTSKDMDENSWIGIPLWVHRRCQYPMFTISNAISYNNLMVQGKEGYGKTGWYDISGKAANKYVEEQGDFLLKKIKSMIEKDPKIIDKNESDTVYIISPFKNVAYKLGIKLDKIGFTRKEKGKVTNIGTIHTFQGKEAPIVFMVLGADTNSKGAATWAVNEANMMNVAATRAKKEFYIIGDRKLYSGLGSDVITKVNNVIREYGNEHPELVDEITD